MNFVSDGSEAVNFVRVFAKALDGNIEGLCDYLDGVDAREAIEGTGPALRLNSHMVIQPGIQPCFAHYRIHGTTERFVNHKKRNRYIFFTIFAIVLLV